MKAILVMDMPSKCAECNFHQYGICHAVRKCITGTPKELKSKPDWCPLKPMPSKKSKKEEWIITGVHRAKTNGFNVGYNACIDEILGGSEE